MDTPSPIRSFERLFLLALILWAVGQVGTMAPRIAQFEATPAGHGRSWMLVLTMALVALVNVAIWYLVARRASATGKWLAVIAAAVSGLLVLVELMALIQPGGPALSYKLVALVASALTVASVVPLFRDDARAWFGEPPARDHDGPETMA